MSEKKVVGNIRLDGARILFRNFSGAPSKYNAAGSRNFSVVIDDHDLAQELINDGWNIKILAPKSEDDKPTYHLPVKVTYNSYPPEIHIETEDGVKTLLDDETINTLDYYDIKYVDVVIRPYTWNEEGDISAYVKYMRVHIEQNPFA